MGVAPGVGDFPEIIVTAYESGGTAGVFRLEQRVPASLAASIDAVINGPIINGSIINGSLINGSIIDGSPSAVRRAARLKKRNHASPRGPRPREVLH